MATLAGLAATNVNITVPDYRVFFIGADGNFEGSRTFVCDTDEKAIVWAQMEDRPIELWSGGRMVKRLSPRGNQESPEK